MMMMMMMMKHLNEFQPKLNSLRSDMGHEKTLWSFLGFEMLPKLRVSLPNVRRSSCSSWFTRICCLRCFEKVTQTYSLKWWFFMVMNSTVESVKNHLKQSKLIKSDLSIFPKLLVSWFHHSSDITEHWGMLFDGSASIYYPPSLKRFKDVKLFLPGGKRIAGGAS